MSGFLGSRIEDLRTHNKTQQLFAAIRRNDWHAFNKACQAGCMFNKISSTDKKNPLHLVAKRPLLNHSVDMMSRLMFQTDLHGNWASFEDLDAKGRRPFDIAVQYSNHQFLSLMLEAMRVNPERNYGTGGLAHILACRDRSQGSTFELLNEIYNVQFENQSRLRRAPHGGEASSGPSPLKHELSPSLHFAQVTELVGRPDAARAIRLKQSKHKEPGEHNLTTTFFNAEKYFEDKARLSAYTADTAPN